MGEMKRCAKCGMTLGVEMFGKYQQTHDGLQRWCKLCKVEYDHERYRLHHTEIVEQQREYRHRVGLYQPYTENTECAIYLGVHIAERALRGFFDNIKQMPMNTIGFDYVCDQDYKIDVKSSCQRKNGSWVFHIRCNTMADYFLCLAFNNRSELTPMHVWVIPGDVVNHLGALRISPGVRGRMKWHAYEKSVERVDVCCH